jgi:tRNA A-37 threonylcarbamoyl transferase component Bud32
MSRLSGGVSSELWKVELPGRTICVKTALQRLNVPGEWLAPTSRNTVEYDWLSFAAPLCPGHVPTVLAHSSDAGMFAMEYLPPEQFPVWKAQLLAGRVAVETAGQVGELLGRLHAASAADPTVAVRFATDANFDALRIGPYLRATASKHPHLRRRFSDLASRTAGTHLAVVHGDVSPKNILIGPQGPVLLDAECAWFGDPAFDVAFCLNHLLIKSILLPEQADVLYDAARKLTDSYAEHIDWESPELLQLRVASLLPALALARVDGLSPVEYLDAGQRDTVRAIGKDLLHQAPDNLNELLSRWASVARSNANQPANRVPLSH